MSQFRVDDVTPTKSGKAWRVKSGDQWYGAFGDSGIEGCVGKVIEAEITTSQKYGPTISKYKVVSGYSETAQAKGIASQTPQNAPRGSNEVTVAPWYMPFCSNVCAHAIAAGLIKEPTDIKQWVLAAKQAAEGD